MIFRLFFYSYISEIMACTLKEKNLIEEII